MPKATSGGMSNAWDEVVSLVQSVIHLHDDEPDPDPTPDRDPVPPPYPDPVPYPGPYPGDASVQPESGTDGSSMPPEPAAPEMTAAPDVAGELSPAPDVEAAV